MRIATILSTITAISSLLPACESVGCKLGSAPEANPDLTITAAQVRYLADIDQLVFEMSVAGTAGATVVAPRGSLDGAPVLGYVFPTSLASTDVGFSRVDGVTALAVTVHPDFDDSPLWDENLDGDTGNDGAVWHTHWVVLGPDDRVPGKQAVLAAKPADRLPATAPKMPMFMDSPGFTVVRQASTIRVVVPAPRVNGRTDFRYDAVAAYMAVNAPSAGHAGTGALPMLGVYRVYSVLSGNLSLPYTVAR
jgi:hypothetical protein